MKRVLIFGTISAFLGIGLLVIAVDRSAVRGSAQVKVTDQKMPEVIMLAKDAKFGAVTFNHVSHNGGKYSIDGTGPIACIECHHTAQPATEVVKYPPLKTAWPTDRTTTLTADLFTKDPANAGVAACRDCHARAQQMPKLITEIPVIKHEASSALITLTNQQAFHRNCDGCHIEVREQNPNSIAPKATSCNTCHKRAS